MNTTTVSNTTYFFESQDRHRKLFYQKFSPEKLKPKALVVITHGLGEHSEAYREVCMELCKTLTVEVVAWDMVGHGKSSGQRGYVGDVTWLTKDFADFINSIGSNNSKLPLFLLSHSLGGLVHLSSEKNLSKKLNICGVIFSNPCISLNFAPPKWKTLGAEMLATLSPRVTLGNEISPDQLSSDLEYLKKHNHDPLKHNRISPRLYLGMLELMRGLKDRDAKLPNICLLSTKDTICDPKATKSYLGESAKIVSFDNSMHEVLNDIERSEAITVIKDFINENI